MKNRPKRHVPLPLAASALMALVAAGGAASLWLLVRAYQQTLRSSVAYSALVQGRGILEYLASSPFAAGEGLEDSEEWAQFDRMVQALQTMEKAIAYVAVREGDVLLYTAHAKAADDGKTEAANRVIVGRSKIRTEAGEIPAITFSLAAPSGRCVELALRKDVVEQRRSEVSDAIEGLFRMALAVFGGIMLICLALIALLARNEVRRQLSLRREEHLAFAGAMAAGIIHDFRNPLSAMKLDAQLLEKEAEKSGAARVRELAVRIVNGIARVESLLREFTPFAAQAAEAETSVFDLNECLRECAEAAAPRFRRAGVELKLELCPSPAPVRAHASEIKRALLNVLENAEHFAPAGTHVTAKTGVDGNEAFAEISDCGPGVPTKEREKIFELFYSRRPGGLGVGLALARTAVERGNGTITVKDADGGGACFVIRLPLAKAEPPRRTK